MSDGLKVLQIIPAPGWVAIHASEGEALERRPLVAWAVLEDGDVVPVETDAEGLTSESSDSPSFVAVEHEGARIPEAELKRRAGALRPQGRSA